MFEPHGPKRLSDIATGDETCFPFFIISPKRLNRMWVDGQGDRPVVLRPGFQSRKRMFMVKSAINDQRPKVCISRTLLLHDNAGRHKIRATTQSLRELGIQVLSHPAYSPDLAICDFWLFPILKDRLAGRKFDRVQDLAKAVNSELRTIPEEDCQGVFRKWQIRLKGCIESHEECFEGLKVSCMYQ
ncbi:transposase [Elysia marginata]|uniref:Transposase n=1 Tax=Elysia marginata TaxID=1093978 RepID=A0AAV4H5X2_9GAST|nr:transposase [Elysia marginata]